MSFRAVLSIFTLVLIAVIIYFSRHELVHAWELLGRVNLWILALLIPGQLLLYFAGGEMLFSYLRAKNSIENVSKFELIRMALEMNFVNHVLPSAGVSGISYMTWRLGKHGVSPGRATMAQIVRYALGFAAFITLLAISVLVVTLDGNINRWIILMSSILVTGMGGMILVLIYLLGSRSRTVWFAGWLTRVVNHLVRKMTFGHKRSVLVGKKTEAFFAELHHDYLALKQDKKILRQPFLWGIVLTITDVMLFVITFWALGIPVNPAPILIAYGIATVTGYFVITPGGAGAYEAVMVGVLALAGLGQGVAIAGIVLTRVIVLIGTIILGYVFYQLAIIKHGKSK
jgi:uncharacterized protein (TIRG00374 family)